MTTGLYRGYSSYEYQKNKSFKMVDVELVKMDLLNHIFTRRGERVHMPTFGTRIPDLAFEPLDDITLMVLEEDIRSVFKFDPRVNLMSLEIIPDYDSHTVSVVAKLLYVELELVGDFDLNITFEGA